MLLAGNVLALPARRCARCGQPFVAAEPPDANWFLLCPACLAEARTVLVALLVVFALGGLLALALAP